MALYSVSFRRSAEKDSGIGGRFIAELRAEEALEKRMFHREKHANLIGNRTKCQVSWTDPGCATLHRIGQPAAKPVAALDPQLILDLKKVSV